MLENNFIELGIVYLMAAIMPGPSIGLILRNSAISKKAGFMAALATIRKSQTNTNTLTNV